MKRNLPFLFCALLLLAALPWPAVGQDNPYGIDDLCYQLFQQAEATVGTPEFEAVNADLLASAIAKKDEKARTLYYVERLKHFTSLKPALPSSADPSAVEAEKARLAEQVNRAFEELKVVARETGYKQYYYYAYSLTRTYYYNNKQLGRATELILEMRNTALREHDEYGQWTGDKYLADLYVAQSDYISAKKYLPEIIRIHHETEDPTIKRQSIVESLVTYADCFPMASDSMRMLISEAAHSDMVMADTVRVNMYLSAFALIDKDKAGYARYRDRVLANPYARRISTSLPRFYEFMDALAEGRKVSFATQYPDVSTLREIKMLQKTAEAWGNDRLALICSELQTSRMELKLSQINEMNLSELEARYGNNRLNADLVEKSRQVERITRIVALLVGLVLLLLVCFLLLHIRTLKRAQERDEKMIADLTAANERARIADAAKTRFLQNMTHEVRTPLNAITGFSQLLALPDGMFQPEEKDEFSRHIVNNTKMLTMLLDDLINSSSMDSGGYRITLEDTECGEICKESISNAEHRLHPGVQLRFVPEMELPFPLRTDPLRVQQVLTNLLTNACKHTPQGEVRLSCSLTKTPGMLTFIVEDTGSGIPADQAERIFERFVKLDDYVQGTGLGLSICRDISSRLGGRVFLDTSYTGGARFVFTVPVDPDAKDQ